MEIFYREKLFHAGKNILKIRKNDFAPSEKCSCYAPVSCGTYQYPSQDECFEQRIVILWISWFIVLFSFCISKLLLSSFMWIDLSLFLVFSSLLSLWCGFLERRQWRLRLPICLVWGRGLGFVWDWGALTNLPLGSVMASKNLGRGHMNYDIQIIVVILKLLRDFFQQRPWIIVKIIMIVFGSHMPNMNYEVYCGSASVELTE